MRQTPIVLEWLARLSLDIFVLPFSLLASYGLARVTMLQRPEDRAASYILAFSAPFAASLLAFLAIHFLYLHDWEQDPWLRRGFTREAIGFLLFTFGLFALAAYVSGAAILNRMPMRLSIFFALVTIVAHALNLIAAIVVDWATSE
jgi:hypothetical protein